MAKKRARTEDGHFVADDPSTPDVNEAWEDDETTASVAGVDPTRKAKQSKAPKAESASEFRFFVSANEEAAAFDIRLGEVKIRGSWDANREHVIWRVPNPMVDVLMKHHHVWSGRIIPAEDN